MSDLNLIGAVKAGHYAEVEELIKKGADLNQQDEQGWTPLNFAAGKGDLPVVKLLVENGADIFKSGRDHRIPYMIALAAGRVPVVEYLKEVEQQYPGEKPVRPERKYCKAYHIDELRKYPQWQENRLDGQAEDTLPGDKVVFIHQDFTVTGSMWHNEDVIFDQVSRDWKEFCANTLKFKVPDDLDLIVPNETNG
jgi:hypothetical protein